MDVQILRSGTPREDDPYGATAERRGQKDMVAASAPWPDLKSLLRDSESALLGFQRVRPRGHPETVEPSAVGAHATEDTAPSTAQPQVDQSTPDPAAVDSVADNTLDHARGEGRGPPRTLRSSETTRPSAPTWSSTTSGPSATHSSFPAPCATQTPCTDPATWSVGAPGATWSTGSNIASLTTTTSAPFRAPAACGTTPTNTTCLANTSTNTLRASGAARALRPRRTPTACCS